MENKNILIIVIAVILLVFISSSLNNGTGGCGFSNMMYGSGFGGMWLFGWLFMALLLVLVVLGIIWLFKQVNQPAQRRQR